MDYSSRAWSPVGQKAISWRKKRNMPLSAVTAISSLDGVIQNMFVQGSVNSDVFRLFLLDLIGILKRGQFRYVIIMDNVAFHKTQLVKELVESQGINILYTAPWSCELNPIEYVFSIWKARVKIPPGVTEVDQVRSYLEQTLCSVNPHEVAQCVNHVKRVLFPKALRKEPLFLAQEVQAFNQANGLEEVALDVQYEYTNSSQEDDQ